MTDSQNSFRLKILSLSKNRTILAERADWVALTGINSEWQSLLDRGIQEFPEIMNQIQSQLQNDNDEVETILKKSMNTLQKEFIGQQANLKKVQQYLK